KRLMQRTRVDKAREWKCRRLRYLASHDLNLTSCPDKSKESERERGEWLVMGYVEVEDRPLENSAGNRQKMR
ncbi:hypothetical protein ALC57_10231, partial [Trachymyrmex cornetzi]